ncbi:MAG: hypothetical protein QXI32_05660, partial [Candidatus Bathyarchaeia archaeon]
LLHILYPKTQTGKAYKIFKPSFFSIGCDLIVCWKHDNPDIPIEVLELKDLRIGHCFLWGNSIMEEEEAG